MKKSYSKKERATIKFIRNSIIILLAAICIITVVVITLDTLDIGDNNGPYTAEQMKHDHDLDGIPDH